MSVLPLLLLAISGFPEASGPQHGAIGGAVVNAADQQPIAGAKVVLRVKLYDEFVPLSETTTNSKGRYLFNSLFVGEDYEYLPGSNQDGVHYPGPRVRLTADDPFKLVKLEVYKAVTEPNPLVIDRHVIVIHPRPGAVHVTESILVDNPTQTCYVGKPMGKDDGKADGKEEAPTTLQLSVPEDVQCTTFRDEALGSQFFIRDGKPTTGVPWTPGKRGIRFAYVVPNEQETFHWARNLDLPCRKVEVRVRTDNTEGVSCNLAQSSASTNDELVFQSDGRLLPAGYALNVDLGQLPVPWMTYGRWAAAALLGLMVVGAGLVWFLRSRRAGPRKSPKDADPTLPMTQDNGRKSGRRNRKDKSSSRRAA